MCDDAKPAMQPARLTIALLACLACLGSGQAAADLRALLAFDTASHWLERVLRDDTSPPPIPPQPVGTADDAPLAARDGQALAEWFGDGEQALYSTYFPDPRVIHGPRVAAGVTSAGEPVHLEQGAYLLDGPDDAVRLRVTLPYSDFPPLARSVWEFALGATSDATN